MARPSLASEELRVKGYIKANPLWSRQANRYLILNKDGNEKGQIKPNPLWSTDRNRYLLLNKDGNTKKTIRPSLLWNDRIIIEKKK